MTERHQKRYGPRDVLRAIAFLSRIPVPASSFEDAEDRGASRDSWAYPLAGLAIALPGTIIIGLAPASGLLPLLAAAFAVAVTSFVTGALHEDGLADTVDGFWGGWEPARRLEIMKDSAIGTYGVLALIGWFGITSIALGSIGITASPLVAAAMFVCIGAASRSVMTGLWASLPPARDNGVGRSQGQPERDHAIVAIGLGVIIALAVATITGTFGSVVLALLAAAIGTVAFRHLCGAKIGGYTGDTLGACQKLVELAMVVTLAFTLG